MDKVRVSQLFNVLLVSLFFSCQFCVALIQVQKPSSLLQKSNSFNRKIQPRRIYRRHLKQFNHINQLVPKNRLKCQKLHLSPLHILSNLKLDVDEKMEQIQGNLYRDISVGFGQERYSKNEWVFAIRSLPKSMVLHRILPAVMSNTIWSAILALMHSFYPLPKFPALPHTLLSSALGLLLVFRTNSAYQRFWESRQFWQQITNHSRNLAMKLADNLPRKMHREVHNLMVALPASLKQHLQGDSNFLGIRPLFSSPEVFDKFCAAHNKPLKICAMLSKLINDGFHDERPQKQTLCDSFLGQITFLIGACERVVTTPIPPTYSRHTSRLLTIFCFTLPLVLVQELSFFVIPTTAIFSWGMIAIDEIGRFIEEPFNAGKQQQLPLEQLIKELAKDLALIFDVEPVAIKGKEVLVQALQDSEEDCPHALYEKLKYYKDYVYV
mmetsp:Transcript_1367/g.1848  ORF Transcript_1367/g.1848 Transcript_1367/m.1848 type:complete len:438 (+) Transcript_1367:150-1463(+)